MKGTDVLRLVEQMHHDKNVDRDVIFEGIESALELAAEKYYGEEVEVEVNIDRDTGDITVIKDEEEIDPRELGRIPAQSAKNVMIQKIREAESNAVFDEFAAMKGDLVQGVVQRHESGAAIVALGKTEAILPRREQIPGETFHVNDRIKAIIMEVKKAGQRVKIILSRTHADFVRRLFETEIPEIQDRIIELRAVAREAGYRSKIAVSSIDLKVDCVGACVGVRGSRIKNIVDELGGERIDIVRWNDSLQVMIPNALQPAEIEEVFIYPRPGRTIVLVQEDQLSLAIGRRGQNVRLGSKLVGWDIEIMTHDELNDSIEKAEEWFLAIPGVNEEMVEVFIEEGFMSYDDLSFCDPAELVELTGMDEELAQLIIDFAEETAEAMEDSGELHSRGAGKSRSTETTEAASAEQPSADEDASEQIEEMTVEAEGGAESVATTIEEQLELNAEGEPVAVGNSEDEATGDEVLPPTDESAVETIADSEIVQPPLETEEKPVEPVSVSDGSAPP